MIEGMKDCLPLLVEEGNVDADPGKQKFIFHFKFNWAWCQMSAFFRKRTTKGGKPEVEVWMASWQCLHLVVQLLGVAFSFQSSHQFVHLGKTSSEVCPLSAAGADVDLRHII